MKKMNIVSLSIISISAIISLKNLPITAELGLSSIFYLILTVFIFFLPISLVIAELASSFPTNGCCYIWASKAFNKRIGIITIWIAWMESIMWFPSILAFCSLIIIDIIKLFININYNEKKYLIIIILIILWSITIINTAV